MTDYLVIMKDKETNEQVFKVIESEPKGIVDDLEFIIYNYQRYDEKDIVVESVTKL